MKLSDYVIQYLAEQLNIRHVFMVVGGANMHLVDSISKNPKMKYVSTQHEQAAAYSAEAYARIQPLSFMLTTSGPGGTNAVSGLGCAWMDSIPVIFISGQVARKDCTDGKTIRQLGVQQINIIDIVKPISKYAVYVDDPLQIRYHLEKAAWTAREGRPGPVWLDIPQDVQMTDIDPKTLKGFTPEPPAKSQDSWKSKIPEIVKLLGKAKRPVLIAGNGIRLSGGIPAFEQLTRALSFPIITTWSANDLMDDNDPLYAGRSGVFGQYGANFAVANSDLVLSIGSRLDTRQTGTRRNSMARDAVKIVVDVSPHELRKDLIKIDVPVCCDAKEFMAELSANLKGFKGQDIGDWRKRCQDWKKKYPVTLPVFREEKSAVNSYVFIEALSEQLASDDIVVTDMGTSLSCTMQTFKVKKGQRLFTNIGFAPMGYGLPGAIGAWYASGRNRIICVSGDGGLQMNIQEFQTLAHNKIPVKLFILNNKEYVTIRHTQDAYFKKHYVGSESSSGYSAPHFQKVAEGYGLSTESIQNPAELKDKIKKVLASKGPMICEINMAAGQPLIPILLQHRRADGSIVTDPIERLSPYLPDEEFRQNMIVKPLED